MKMMKKKTMFCCAATLLGAVGAVSAAVVEPERPHIIFMYADDFGWGDLSSHGHPYIQTPNLDRLRSQGMDFSQFNVLNPVCSPSRAAVMTGLFPARLSIHQHFASSEWHRRRNMPDWLDPKAEMLPRILKEAGYATAHYGKWHLTNSDCIPYAPPPSAYGYDDYAGWTGPAPGISHFNIYDRALNFIRAHEDQPVFINLWMRESHTPHRPSNESMEKYSYLPKEKQVYAAVITDADNGVGKILSGLEDLGIADQTLLVFSSDNGPENSRPQNERLGDGYGTKYSVGSTGGLRGRKRSLFEGGVRVPFLVRWRGKTPEGKINNSTVITAVDLLPTFCAAAGVRLPQDYQSDGENMLPALVGQDQRRSKPIFWEWRGFDGEPDWWPRLAVRVGDWKLLMTDDGSRVELYNLEKDRAEACNVAAQYPEMADRLCARLLAWKKSLPVMPDSTCRIPLQPGAGAEK